MKLAIQDWNCQFQVFKDEIREYRIQISRNNTGTVRRCYFSEGGRRAIKQKIFHSLSRGFKIRRHTGVCRLIGGAFNLPLQVKA